MNIENKIKKYIPEIQNIEEKDLQFIALQKLYNKINFDFFLELIIINSLVCYQLSGTGEKYWEEFSEYFQDKKINNLNEIIPNMKTFLRSSKNNKRLINMKIKRLDKAQNLLKDFHKNKDIYIKDFTKINSKIAKEMSQKENAKTIVFACKIFVYGTRIYLNKFLAFPFEIQIPIDSRLQKIYDIYGDENINIEKFYTQLSKKLKIPPLHLDSIIWNNIDEFISKK